MSTVDVVVIGGGPGGYVAAIRARQLGLTATLVERAHLGGICLNWGCIPTKALLRTAELFDTLKHLDAYGLSAGPPAFDLAKVIGRSRKVAGQLAGGVRHLLKKNGVTVVEGHGRLAGPGAIAVAASDGTTTDLKAGHIVLATGARARTLPGLDPDRHLIWTYREALNPDTMPRALLVVGSGAIGIEFASFYRSLGAEVTVVEMQDRILPVEDPEISGLARTAFEKRGIKILTGAVVKGIDQRDGGLVATITAAADGKQFAEVAADRMIVAVGIVGNVEELGLEGTRVRVERGHIVTDRWSATDEPGVYAIGDVAGPPWLAHKASHEGVICIEKIAGAADPHPLDTTRIPGCTYATPQVASVGLTESAATAAGHKVRVGRFPYRGNGKAIALGEPEGLIKTVFDADTGELLGAHMIGAEVTELIQGYAIARTLESTEAELMHTVFPHPTLSEMMHESTLDAFDRAIHF